MHLLAICKCFVLSCPLPSGWSRCGYCTLLLAQNIPNMLYFYIVSEDKQPKPELKNQNKKKTIPRYASVCISSPPHDCLWRLFMHILVESKPLQPQLHWRFFLQFVWEQSINPAKIKLSSKWTQEDLEAMVWLKLRGICKICLNCVSAK